MPTYDYHCDTCGATFEWFQSIKDDSLTHCPQELCTSITKGQGSVQRKISGGAGLVFNGDGFYLTDYVRKSDSSVKSSSDSSSEKPSSGSTSSDGASSASTGSSSVGTSGAKE